MDLCLADKLVSDRFTKNKEQIRPVPSDNHSPDPAQPAASTPSSPPRASRLWLYLPVGIFLAAIVAYAFAWRYGAGVMRDEIARWETAQQEAGLVVSHGEIEIEGFPFFLRASIPAPRFADPDQGLEWQADHLFADTSPLNPTRIVLSPDGNQQLLLTRDRREVWDISAEVFRVDLAENRMGLDLSSLVAIPQIGASDFERVEISRLSANTLIADNPANQRPGDLGRLAISARDIALISADDAGTIALAEIDLSASATGMHAFLNRQAGESDIAAWQRGGGELTIEGLRLMVSDGRQAIPTQLGASGKIRIDDEAYPAGSVQLSMRDHLALLSVLNRRAVLTEEEARTADEALRTLNSATGGEIVAPLKLRGGKLRLDLGLGTIPLMDLDRIG